MGPQRPLRGSLKDSHAQTTASEGTWGTGVWSAVRNLESPSDLSKLVGHYRLQKLAFFSPLAFDCLSVDSKRKQPQEYRNITNREAVVLRAGP